MRTPMELWRSLDAAALVEEFFRSDAEKIRATLARSRDYEEVVEQLLPALLARDPRLSEHPPPLYGVTLP